MAEPIKQPTEAEIAAKTGFGETAEQADAAQEESTETEEETENNESDTEETTEESDESTEEEGSKKKPPVRESRGKKPKVESEEDTESADSEDESEEEESEDEGDESDTEETEGKKRTVPYSLLKSKNATIKKLRAQLDAKRADHSEATEEGDEAAAATAKKEVEDAAKALAEELGIDEKGLAKLLETVSKLSSKRNALPKEITDRLKVLDEIQKKNLAEQETAHFTQEWDMLDLKKTYPNASKAALKEAKELMDSLSHTKQYHKQDLDYILFKNKAKFDTVLKFASTSKSGEKTKRMGKEVNAENESESETLTDIEDLNPTIMKEREAKELDRRRTGMHSPQKEYTITEARPRD